MSARRWSTRLVRSLIPAATIALAVAAHASERSQILVAKGELAYHRGQTAEARALFERAVSADPADATAHLALGQTLLALGEYDAAADAFTRARELRPDSVEADRGLQRAREAVPMAPDDVERLSGTVGEIGRLAGVRRERARRWGLTFTTGLQYDSNIILRPHNRTGAGVGDKDDIAFILSGGGHYDVVERPDLLFRLEYDLYQTLHPDLDDYDFRSQRVQGTISYALRPELWVGLQGGYNHYTLGPHSYLGEPFVMPFVSLVEGSWGLTQINYRHGDSTYFSTPFNELRDGPTESAGIRQDLFFAGDRYVSAGYQFTSEDPDPARRSGVLPAARSQNLPPSGPVPSDYQLDTNELYVGGGLPLGWGVYLDAQYLYRNDNYTRRNGLLVFRDKRQDDGHFVYASVSRPILPHVSVAVVYYGTINDSNVPQFEYQRHVVATVLQVTY